MSLITLCSTRGVRVVSYKEGMITGTLNTGGVSRGTSISRSTCSTGDAAGGACARI